MSRPADVLEAAGVGHRITHEDDLPPPRTITAVAVQTLTVQPRQSGAVMATRVGRTITVQSLGELEGEDPGEAPDPCGVIELGSPDTFIGRDMRPVATADEEMEIPCEDHSDGPILTGALTVFVNGKPIARRTDELDCGAFIGEGEPTVLVGGASTERTERRPEGRYGRTGGLGPLLGREMYRMHEGVGPKLGRATAGGEDVRVRPRREAVRTPPGVSVGRLLTRPDRTTARVTKTLSR